MLGFGLLSVALALAGVAFGPVPLGLGEVLQALAGQAEPRAQAIVAEIRAPRVALAAAVGAGLALSGTTLQGVLRNPLADPGLIGVTAGGSLVAVAVIVFGGLVLGAVPPGLRPWLMPAAAFVGAAGATALVFALARRGGATHAATLILAGVAVNAIAGAMVGLMIYVSDEDEEFAQWAETHSLEKLIRTAAHAQRSSAQPKAKAAKAGAGGLRRPSYAAGGP